MFTFCKMTIKLMYCVRNLNSNIFNKKLLNAKWQKPVLLNIHCNSRNLSNNKDVQSQPEPKKFETVYAFPLIRFVALFHRLKVYQLSGSVVIIPTTGLLQLAGVIPSETFQAALYFGLFGTALFGAVSLPFKNIIGFLYVSEDNKEIKISYVDFWGKRQDRIVDVQDWSPLLNMTPRATDFLFLTPELSDGSKYKLFIKYGRRINEQKIGQVLE